MIRKTFFMGLFVVAIAAESARAQNFEINWFTIDGGGVMDAAGGPFVLSGTTGQPDAGDSAGGPFVLRGGFWPGTLGERGGGCTGRETISKAKCKIKQGAVNKLTVVVKGATPGENYTAVLDSGQTLDVKAKSKGTAKFVFKGGDKPPCGDNAVSVCDLRKTFRCGC